VRVNELESSAAGDRRSLPPNHDPTVKAMADHSASGLQEFKHNSFFLSKTVLY